VSASLPPLRKSNLRKKVKKQVLFAPCLINRFSLPPASSTKNESLPRIPQAVAASTKEKGANGIR